MPDSNPARSPSCRAAKAVLMSKEQKMENGEKQSPLLFPIQKLKDLSDISQAKPIRWDRLSIWQGGGLDAKILLWVWPLDSSGWRGKKRGRWNITAPGWAWGVGGVQSMARGVQQAARALLSKWKCASVDEHVSPCYCLSPRLALMALVFVHQLWNCFRRQRELVFIANEKGRDSVSPVPSLALHVAQA